MWFSSPQHASPFAALSCSFLCIPSISSLLPPPSLPDLFWELLLQPFLQPFLTLTRDSHGQQWSSVSFMEQAEGTCRGLQGYLPSLGKAGSGHKPAGTGDLETLSSKSAPGICHRPSPSSLPLPPARVYLVMSGQAVTVDHLLLQQLPSPAMYIISQSISTWQ